MNEHILRDLLLNELCPSGALLRNSERNCLKNVYLVVEEEYLRPAYKSDQNEDKAYEAALQISSLQDDMRSIIKNLRFNAQEKESFIKLYPEWKKNREKTIEKLKQIAKAISTGKSKYDWWKLAGYSTSFIGGGLTLASLFAAPFTLGMSVPVAGATLAATGVGGVLGSSYFEYKSLKKNIDQFKKLTEEDKKYFQGMRAYLKCTTELENALADILKINISKEIMKSVEKLAETAVRCNNDAEQLKCIKEKIKEIIQCLPKNETSPERIIVVGTLIQILVTICLLNMKNKFSFDFRILTIRSFVAVFSFMDNSLDAARLAATFGDDLIVKGAERTILGRAFAAFGMVMDFAGIVLTSIEINNGSESKYAEMIRNAAEELRRETDVVDKIYKTITS